MHRALWLLVNEAARLIRLGQAKPADALLAMIELGLARLRLDSRTARAMVVAPAVPNYQLASNQVALIERVAFVIPRVAARMPWRADCLIQALAAARWLGRHGVATTLTFGVPRGKSADFEAHAWLKAGDRIVTGGDISGYRALSRP